MNYTLRVSIIRSERISFQTCVLQNKEYLMELRRPGRLESAIFRNLSEGHLSENFFVTSQSMDWIETLNIDRHFFFAATESTESRKDGLVQYCARTCEMFILNNRR